MSPPRGEPHHGSTRSHHQQHHGRESPEPASGSSQGSSHHPHQHQHHEHRHYEYDFSEGDHVVYHPVGGSVQTSTGIVKRIMTHTAPAGESGINAKASEEHPRFVIENDHTHKETAYKRENIIELVDE
jgi:hypothetical protein